MKINDKVKVQVQTEYVESQSEPEKDKYVFAYHIAIDNQDNTSVNLLNRYWLITDGDGAKSEVSGSGVVGEQPLISSGETYHYSSGCVLSTPVGTMEGYYEMQMPDSSMVKVPIPVFSLTVPKILH
jgi:ApaG protein